LTGGINDILLTESFEAAKANLSAMVNQCAARGVRPIVGIPYPLNPDVPQPWEPLIDFRRAAEIQAAYADWLRLFIQTFRLRFVDFDKTWRNDFSPAARAQLYLPDGLHPSPAGHRRIADEILQQIFPQSGASKNPADSGRA
jgi:lysophospholipase L1-like esterase